MSETEHEEATETEAEPPVVDDDPDQDEAAEEEETPEPTEEEAETVADREREQELLAQQQETEQRQVMDDRDIEQRQKKLIRAADAYVKKVVDAMGPDLDGAKPCPLCADFFPGFRFPIMPPDENMPAIRVAIGLEPGDNLPHDGYSRKCDSCDGWGFVDSGSRVSGQTKLTCIDCQGKGWKAVGAERENGAITGSNVVPMPVNSGPPAVSNNDPPEVEKLRQLGYIVVPKVEPVEVPGV